MADFIYKYKWIIILLCLSIGIGSILMIPRTEIDPEMRNYVPQSIKSRIETDKIESEFGVQDLAVILFSDSCIISNDNLNQIKNIDRSISRINGVSSRISPFTIKSITSEEGMMKVDPLIKKIPSDKFELQQLGKDILENRFARDIVVSSDLTTASITATINSSVAEKETLQKIDSVINSYPGKAKIIKGGLPYIRQSILKDVSKDAIILIPVALLIMLLVLKANLGSWRSVMLPFSVVVLTTAFSIALIPLAGWKMSIITLLVPVILIAVANNYGIYLVARFQELSNSRQGASKKELVRILIKSLNMPILFSGLTTIAGVLGLLTHSIIPAKQVGVLAAAGVSLALLMSLLLIPALIFVSGTGLISTSRKGDKTRIFDGILNRLANVIINNPGRILLVSAIVIIIFSSGIGFLRINTNQENYFSSRHPVRQASELINSKFGGSQTISVMIKGDIKDPEIMKRIDMLTKEIEHQKGVGNVFSISQVVREMSKAIFTSTEHGYNQIPDTREAIAQMFELYNMSGSPDDFKELTDLENTKAHILIRLSKPENDIIKAVKAKISELTVDFPAEVSIGGYAIIMADFAESIIKGQISSLLFAVITVILLLTIIFKSFKGGLIGSIPLIASIIILFGFMGYSHIALDAATALLSSIMIGVGVDFTIQYIWCFNLQIRSGLSYPEAISASMKTIGRSIIINALSVMAGFGALIFSGFTSIRFFGYLVLISIGSCLVGALVIIPAFLMKYRPGFIGFETGNKKTRRNEKERNIIDVTTAAFAGSGATA
jgi:hydrophobe/amphiphile efflux-3 (HAE3) family protein